MIRAQMEVANVQYYNDFDIKLLEDALLELSASKLDLYNKDERTFIFKTGERGLVKFNKAVKDMVSGWYPTGMLNASVNNPGVISKSGSKIHDNALSAGFQFTEYKAPNNITIRVESDPLYDDLVRNKIMHPEGGPAMSYRFDILYIGTMDQPNIQIAKIKNQDEMRSYRWGIRNPFTGAMGNPYMSFEEDEAEFHRFTQLGVFILDPTRTMSIIPSILG